MYTINNLVKTFERNEKHKKKTSFNAVDNVSFNVNDREVIGIIGPNGAGKTTLLRMLAKLMTPTSGEIIYSNVGVVYEDATEIKKNIGYLSGNTKLYGRLSCREMLQIMGGIYGMKEKDILSRIEYISNVLSLDEFIDNRIEKLSTGQTQRTSIARCLIHNPNVYIFDEPTLGLDVLSSNSILKFMESEKKNGKTIIYSTHYMAEAEQLCDKVVILGAGKIVSIGTVDEMKKMTDSNTLQGAFMQIMEREGIINEK